MSVSVAPGAQLYLGGDLIGETGRVRTFPVFPATGNMAEAAAILTRGFGIGIDFSVTSTAPETFFVPAGNYHSMTALAGWEPSIYSLRNAPAVNGGSYPAPSEFCGRQGHVTKIHRAGMPPCHPTKGYRRKPKSFRGGRR